jgi:hypothetical protein
MRDSGLGDQIVIGLREVRRARLQTHPHQSIIRSFVFFF